MSGKTGLPQGVRFCDAGGRPQKQRLQKEVKELLGQPLLNCSFVTATKEGGVRVEATDAGGTRRVVEINKKGVYKSTYCEGIPNQLTDVLRGYGDKIQPAIELACKGSVHVRQGWSVSPQKLAKVRALILRQSPKATKK